MKREDADATLWILMRERESESMNSPTITNGSYSIHNDKEQDKAITYQLVHVKEINRDEELR
jgi:hypothetical protein